MHESWWYANILRALQASVSSALPEVRVPTSKLLRESRIVELMSFCRNAQHTEIPCTEQAVALRIVTLRVINNGALTTCKKKRERCKKVKDDVKNEDMTQVVDVVYLLPWDWGFKPVW
jgi:hypothetical protein